MLAHRPIQATELSPDCAHLPGSPFMLRVHPNNAGTVATAHGVALSLVTAGMPAKFSVRARDAYGNAGLLEHAARFVTRMKARSAFDVRDNKYTVVYDKERRVYTASAVATSTRYDRTLIEHVRGGGIFATYYSDVSTTQNADTAMLNQAVSKVDSIIDWSSASGSAGMASPLPSWSGYAARWAGFVRARYSEEHTFRLSVRQEYERVRLWVDNMLVIDQWASLGATVLDGVISLDSVDDLYEIRLDYARAGTSTSAQGVKMQWASAGAGGALSVVPSDHLYQASPLNGMPIPLRVAPATVCSSTSKVSGMTLFTAGAYSGFTVQVRDAYNNAREGAATPLFVSVRRSEDFCVTYPSQSSSLVFGTYTATYPYIRSGTYSMHAEAVTPGGLLGVIYSDQAFTVPVASRIDSSLSFDWGAVSSPSTQLSDGVTFSARWTGYILVPSPGVYTFSMVSNSGAQVSISSVQVINYAAGLGARVAAVSFDARVYYPIEVKYSCAYRPCFAQLRWSSPPLVPDQIIPARYLHAPGPLISNSPVSFSVRPGPVDPSHSTCRGDGLTLATSGAAATFSIRMRDMFGNDRNFLGDVVAVKVEVAGAPYVYAVTSRSRDAASLVASYQVRMLKLALALP
jgi:hypothetical protein